MPSPEPTPHRTIAALEKVFAAEIEGRLPFQSRAKIYQKLCDAGMLEPMQRVVGGPPFPVTISGYQLTHAGRFAYCESCKDVEDVE